MGFGDCAIVDRVQLRVLGAQPAAASCRDAGDERAKE
jgi:hypothetical protein